MEKEVWHMIFKKYLENYYSIHNLHRNGIIDDDEKSLLLSKLADDIATTFDREINYQTD